jgi:hypothetical protein
LLELVELVLLIVEGAEVVVVELVFELVFEVVEVI